MRLYCADLNVHFNFYVLPGPSPTVLSVSVLCRDSGYAFSWDPGSNQPRVTTPTKRHIMLCDASDNTPVINAFARDSSAKLPRYRIAGVTDDPASDADDEAQTEAFDEFAADGLSSPLDVRPSEPLDAEPSPQPHPVSRYSDSTSGVANESSDFLTEFIRRNRKVKILGDVPNAINEIDTFWYDVNGKLLHSDLCRKRDPDTMMLRYSAIPRRLKHFMVFCAIYQGA